MKIVEHVEHKMWGSAYHPVVTQIFPFIGPDADETAFIMEQSEFGEMYETDLKPGYIAVSEKTGEVVLNFDSEWLWEPNEWPLDLFEKFTQAAAKAVQIGRSIQAQVTTT